ncbi:MAG: hypothetical protein LUF89_06005 [Ruminococcus sp.]|nr:hypothetical protein [Ruminococcus sp.]
MYYYLENSEIVAFTTLPANYRLHDTLTLLPGCLLIGLVVGVVVLLSPRGFYRFKQGKSVNQYLQNSDIRFTRRVDQFIGQHITRTRINNGSNGGHGGGSHGGDGLSHGGHGGGGHHR